MIQIEDKILSLDLFEKHFICDLDKCLGSCCVHGDSGAPVTKEEIDLINGQIDKIIPYLSAEGVDVIKKEGISVIDRDGDLVTTLIGDKEDCVFTYYNEKGICLCGIEKAYRENKINFNKPISCHLYPIRVKKFGDNIALNYDKWDICSSALIKGKKEGVPVFRFLKEPIIRCFGSDFYDQMEEAYLFLRDENNK